MFIGIIFFLFMISCGGVLLSGEAKYVKVDEKTSPYMVVNGFYIPDILYKNPAKWKYVKILMNEKIANEIKFIIIDNYLEYQNFLNGCMLKVKSLYYKSKYVSEKILCEHRSIEGNYLVFYVPVKKKKIKLAAFYIPKKYKALYIWDVVIKLGKILYKNKNNFFDSELVKRERTKILYKVCRHYYKRHRHAIERQNNWEW